MKKLILVFVFFLSNMSVNAENKNKDTHTATSLSDSVTDNSLVGSGMQEVVVTGQYTPISADKAIHKIRIIGREKIDAMNAQNLKDVLSNEMSIRLSQDNILGSSMSLQGVSGENVKILIDGVPVIGRQNGNIDLSQINLTTIERIEIIEGPMSVNFGTNALAGTINLITRKVLKNTFEAGISAYYETIGTYNTNARLGYNDKRNTILVSGGRNFFDGWHPGESVSLNTKPAIADNSRYQQWKPKQQYFTDLQYIYRIGNSVLNYKVGYFTEQIVNKGMPRAPYGENAIDDYYKTFRIDNTLYLNTQLKAGSSIDVFFAYNDYKRIKNAYYRDLTKMSSELTTGFGDQDTSRFTLLNSRGSFNSANEKYSVNYQLGYDISMEQAFGVRIKNGNQRIDDYALFSTAEFNVIKKLIFRPGLRFAYNTQYKAPVIPSVNIKYKFSNLFTIRASYAKGFRSPTLKELYFYFVDVNHNIQGNEALKSEHSDNYSLNIGGVQPIREHIFKYDINFYYNDIRNLISLTQLSGATYSYANIGMFKTIGTQLTTEYKYSSLNATVGGAYIGRYNQLTETADVRQFSFSPELRMNIMYEFKKAATQLSVFYKYTGKTPGYGVDANGEIIATSINDYSIADISVAKFFFKKHISITMACKNMFDVKNVNLFSGTNNGTTHSSNSSSMPLGTGRNYCLKLDIQLSSN